MIVCKNCGTQNEVGAQFCGNCGTFLEWSGEPAADDTPTQVQPTPPGPTFDPSITPAPPPDPGATQTIPNAIICRACGTPNEADRVYCKSCATELAAAMPPGGAGAYGALPPPAPTQSGGGGGIPKVALGGVAAVAVLAVAAFAFLNLRGGGPSATASPAPSSPGPTTAASSSAPPSASPSESVEPSTSPSASPSVAPPVLAGKILLTLTPKDDPGDSDIGVVTAGTHAIKKLITSGNVVSPSWSPDKKRFVFVRRAAIWVADANGKNEVRLTPLDAGDGLPEWSPVNKDLIAFSSRRDGGLEVYTVNVKTKAVKQLTNNANGIDDRGPTWSPDGKRIAFVSERAGENDIWVMNADGSGLKNLTPNDGDASDVDPSWSPDGQTIAWASSRDSATLHVWFMRPDGGGKRLAIEPDDDDVPDHDPDWSPDGKFIAFHRGSDGEVTLLASVFDVSQPGTIVDTLELDDDFVRLPSWR